MKCSSCREETHQLLTDNQEHYHQAQRHPASSENPRECWDEFCMFALVNVRVWTPLRVAVCVSTYVMKIHIYLFPVYVFIVYVFMCEGVKRFMCVER